MARLPTPGGDNNQWGNVLNDFLRQSHTSTGSLKSGAVNNAIADGSIAEDQLDLAVQTKLNTIAPVTSVNGQTGAVTITKNDVGLGNVDNTSDANKPISTATQTALDAKADKSTTIATGTGLTGGGDLSANRNFSVVDDTTIQKVRLSKAGGLVGTRQELNFIEGANTTIAAVDDAVNNRVDITITASGSGTPATTVVDETSYGQAFTVGTATNYAREDHTHGTPSLTSTAPATTLEISTAASLGVATDPARADHVHPMAAAGVPSASNPGDAQATGVATTFAASDHVHAREAFGNVTALTSFNVAATNGVAASVARSDHVHGVPALGTVVTKTVDQASTSATYADITDLGLNVDIGSYTFDFLIPYTGSVNNGSGIKLRLDGPTQSFLSYVISIQSANTTYANYYRSAFLDEQSGVVITTAGNIYVSRIRGRVTTTASGTLQPHFGITNGSTTTTVKAGAYATLQQF